MENLYFTNSTEIRLNEMFGSERDYKIHMNNLWKTRAGLYTIMETRPELTEVIRMQFGTLNELINALLPDKLPYPPYDKID